MYTHFSRHSNSFGNPSLHLWTNSYGKQYKEIQRMQDELLQLLYKKLWQEINMADWSEQQREPK